jgi:hypothetical protein
VQTTSVFANGQERFFSHRPLLEILGLLKNGSAPILQNGTLHVTDGAFMNDAQERDPFPLISDHTRIDHASVLRHKLGHPLHLSLSSHLMLVCSHTNTYSTGSMMQFHFT